MNYTYKIGHGSIGENRERYDRMICRLFSRRWLSGTGVGGTNEGQYQKQAALGGAYELQNELHAKAPSLRPGHIQIIA